MDSPSAVLGRIERLGYIVAIFRLGNYAEAHAIGRTEPRQSYIARSVDESSLEMQCRLARELARMIGLEVAEG